MIKLIQKFGLLAGAALSLVGVVFAAVGGQWAVMFVAAGATFGWLALHILAASNRSQNRRVEKQLRSILSHSAHEQPAADTSAQDEIHLRTLEEIALIRAEIAAHTPRS